MRLVQLTDDLLRNREIETFAFLDFLKVAVERPAILKAKDGELEFQLSLELTHTLKANLILLLYNAMEATLIELLNEMHDAIDSNCSSTDTLNAQLLRVVLKTVRKEAAQNVLSSPSPLHASLFQFWMDDWKNRNSGKEKRDGSISGSVDGRVFYEQLKNYGVVDKTPDDRPPPHLTNLALQKVKNRRNELAHGEKSFTDLGRELAVPTLEIDSHAVFETLKNIASEVNSYLHNQRYLAQPPADVASLVVAANEA
jgi:hypothetical protein